MSENTMTPATNNFREFETGNEFEPKVPIRFIGSATPISDFLQLYDNRKTRENYRLAISAYLRCFNPGTSNSPMRSILMQLFISGNLWEAETIITISEWQGTFFPETMPL